MKDYIKKGAIVLTAILLVVTVYFLIQNKKDKDYISDNKTSQTNDYQLVLFGPEEVSIYKGDKYEEIGYYALYKNQIVTKQVNVFDRVDNNTLGTYIVTYNIDNVVKRRIVNVIENPNDNIDDITLELVGNKTVNIYTGDTYYDAGCLAFDKDGNNISSKIVTDNNVNTEIEGNYKVTYSILENNEWKSIEREVIVTDNYEEESNLEIDVEYDSNNVGKSLELTIVATGNKFSYIKLPDETKVLANLANYTVDKNGTYYFYAYDTAGNYQMKMVQITNIDVTKPIASCKAKSLGDKTDISVTANDNSGIQKYVYQGYYASTLPNYTINNYLDNARVTVYDNAGNSQTVLCEMEKGNLEIHFIAGVSDDDAILIRSSNKVIMIDGGRYAAKDKIVNYLKDLGITKIDVMMGSHVHWNHVQAQAAILDNFQVSELYYSVDIMNCVSKKHCKSDDVKYIKDKISKKGLTPKIVSVGDTLTIGDLKLYFIGPTRGIFTTFENANSSVFIMQYGDNKFLFTGDTPSEYMNTSKFNANAQKLGVSLDVDVLKWPHHGYETLSNDFFKATTPKYAIIPNCCSCSSKYPSSTNKSLMKKYGTSYYQVCDSKNIVLISDGKNITIKTNQKASDYKR